MDSSIFLQTSIVLGVTISIAFIIRLLKQPLIVAYIIAGIVSGPLLLNLLQDNNEIFTGFGQFGVVLLLFVVGLNLNFSYLKSIGKVALITGIGQVIFTGVVGMLILLALGLSTLTSLYLAIAITFSSTIIILKLLSDKRESESTYGRYTIGLMLVQDLIAIAILIFLSVRADSSTLGHSLNFLVAKGIILVALLFVVSKYVLPRILRQVADSSEFLFVFTVTWCFGIANLVHWFGFSIEIGAVIAGLTLGSSPYQREISSRIKPLRDFFIVLFFIILGSEMQLANLQAVLAPAIILSAFILVGNPLILYFLFRASKLTRRNSFLAGITSAQVSEFGFILLFTGNRLGDLTGPELPIFTLVALITIFVSSYVITYSDNLFKIFKPWFKLFGPDKYHQKKGKTEHYDVWVFGYHRLGWKACEALKKKGVKFAVVDFNPEAISKLNRRKIPAFFGDVGDLDFLESLPLKTAKTIISTVPRVDDQLVLLTHLNTSKKPYVITTAYHNKHLEQLYLAGADYVVMPHLLGGEWIANIILHKGIKQQTFKKLRQNQELERKLKYNLEPTQK